MALIPVEFPFGGFNDALVPRPYFGTHFGLGVPHEVRKELHRLEREAHRLMKGIYADQQLQNLSGDKLENDKDHFKVTVDVSHFKPEELTVTNDGNVVVVQGKHEERPDEHGFISRQFTRRYVLPKDAKAEAITCQLEPNGFLTLEAPKLALPGPAAPRTIPIQAAKQAEIEQAKAKK